MEENERVLALDVLRGFALLGILVVNMQFFTMPMMSALDGPGAGAALSEKWSWTLVRVLFEAKFISMFSLLFGAGLILQKDRVERRGASFTRLFLRRMGVLWAIGAIHAVLLWYGDILLLYATIGVVMLAAARLKPRTLIVLAVISLAASALLTMAARTSEVVLATLEERAESDELDEEPDIEAPPAQNAGNAEGAADAESEGEPGEIESAPEGDTPPTEEDEDQDQEQPRGIEAIFASVGDPTSSVWIAGETAAYREGPLADALAFRVITFLFSMLAAVFGYGWRVLGMFMVGVALLKSGFFLPESRVVQSRVGLLGLAIGLPMEAVSAAIVWSTGFESSVLLLMTDALHEVGSVFLCLGYVGLLTFIVSRGALRGPTTALARTGRLALTTYLSQTLIATAIMYWWGLGLFGGVGRPRQIAIALALYALQVLFSAIYLTYLRIGPVEWVWRSLAYGRPQPWRRPPVAEEVA